MSIRSATARAITSYFTIAALGCGGEEVPTIQIDCPRGVQAGDITISCGDHNDTEIGGDVASEEELSDAACYTDLSKCPYDPGEFQGDEMLEKCGMPYVCPVDYTAEEYPNRVDDLVCVVFLVKECLDKYFPKDSGTD